LLDPAEAITSCGPVIVSFMRVFSVNNLVC